MTISCKHSDSSCCFEFLEKVHGYVMWFIFSVIVAEKGNESWFWIFHTLLYRVLFNFCKNFNYIELYLYYSFFLLWHITHWQSLLYCSIHIIQGDFEKQSKKFHETTLLLFSIHVSSTHQNHNLFIFLLTKALHTILH